MRLNLNDNIKVKLTEHGKDIYYHQYDRTNAFLGRELCKPSYPKVDEDGYTTFQLWCFMELYGVHIGMTLPNVIEPLDIVFDEPTIEPEIMPDGTLHITVNADVASIDRILLSQEGTHAGDLYYKDLERKTGQWILADTYDGRKRYRCSECLAFALKTDDGQENLSDYCPVCGAGMEGEDDGTD